MSTTESKRNPSQAKPQSHKQGNSIQPKAQRAIGNRKPLPFDDDDDDTGDTKDAAETSNPKIEDIKG